MYISFAITEKFKGVCAPAKCDDKKECPIQGRPESGVLTGTCKVPI
jgi:hypothetical protein